MEYNSPAPMNDIERQNLVEVIRASRAWGSTLEPSKFFRNLAHEGDPLQLEFRYTNWKGRTYTYVVLPESVEFGRYDPTHGDQREPRWVLNAYISTRDGDPRHDMGTRRRTFLLAEIENLIIKEGS